MTESEFEQKTGQTPINDDLDRVNCQEIGSIGHSSCGWCGLHDLPRFQCSCRAKKTLNDICDSFLKELGV